MHYKWCKHKHIQASFPYFFHLLWEIILLLFVKPPYAPHLDTAAVKAVRSSHVPSAVAWADDLCRAVCDQGRSLTTAPASAVHPAAFLAQPGQVVVYAPPHAETPPTGNIHISSHPYTYREFIIFSLQAHFCDAEAGENTAKNSCCTNLVKILA